MDWNRFLPGYGAHISTALFDEIGRTSQKTPSTQIDDHRFVDRLNAEPTVRRLAVLQAHVESVACRVLGVAEGKSLPPRRPLHEMGMDSLMSVELRNALAASIGRALPATTLFDYPTIESLALYLAKSVLHLEIAGDTTEGDAVAAANRNLKELENLTESEAEALLLAELDKVNISSHD